MSTGVVKFFNPAKKFGFITPDDAGKDLYFASGAAPADGIAQLKPGRRVSFEREADVKGDKAVNLKLLEAPPVVVAPVARQSLVLYCDPARPESQIVEAALRAANLAPTLIDYAATPLTVDQLKRLALLVGAAGQSLVHRYHPMFLELRLDDRFIAEAEYWTGVAEHPILINGPILVAGARAGVCLSAQDVAAFLNPAPAAPEEKKPKQISARLAAMMAGQPVAPLPKPKPVVAVPTPDPVPRKAVIRLAPRAAKAPPPPRPPAAKAAPAKKAQVNKPAKKPAAKAAKPAAKKSKPPVKAKKKR